MGKWLWGVIILAIASLLLSLIGPWSATKRSAQMGSSIENALSASEFENVKVNMSGNVAKLTGDVATNELKAKAEKIAAGTECESCKKKGKIWHVVKNKLNVKAPAVVKPKPAPKPVIPTQSPYTYKAVKAEDGSVTIEGYVQNEAEKARIEREAKELFGDNLKSVNLKIANGAPNGQWGNVLTTYTGALASLNNGNVNIEGANALITGSAANTDVRDRLNGIIGKGLNGYSLAGNISVGDGAAQSVGTIASKAVCQEFFNDVKSKGKINFATNKADFLGADSYKILDAMADALAQCESFNVEIGGHADARGDDAYNLYLSDLRANAVMTYLTSNGIDTSRLTAVGYGETRPIASNDTREGLAANRRIEFVITESE